FRYLAALERTQWLARSEIESLQLAALRQLLAHAYANCAYYRATWNELGLAPDRVDGPEGFRQWPIIDRDTIRRHRAEMRGPARMRLLTKATGGSSGVPLQFDLNYDSNERRTAAAYRGYGWAGAMPGTKQVYLWGVLTHGASLRRRWNDAAYNRLYRREMLNCFELSDGRAIEFAARLARARPEAIVAYTGPLYAWARALDEQGIRPFAPRSIVVGAEKLYPFQRQLIERVFQAPVFETYGSREFMLIGAECDRHEGLHLTMEHLLVEVVDDAGCPTPDGEEGNVVITDLYNYGMPFIRYANGDRAVAGWTECGCGRGLPMLRKVVGRRLDVLSTPDGRRIPGEFFPHLLKEFAAIKRFQVVQERPDTIDLRLVTTGDWTADDQRRLHQQVSAVTGPELTMNYRHVGEIALTAAGKLQVVVNRCAAYGADKRVEQPLAT
ncbi:MAG TPA: hypothetical protein VFW87_06590, partial [Pirellulales bacterium]|nr:hypothetical protein [Pirellulales bacterium]